MNSNWHPQCFCCEECNGELADAGFIKCQGRALCHTCNARVKAGVLGKHICHQCQYVFPIITSKYKSMLRGNSGLHSWKNSRTLSFSQRNERRYQYRIWTVLFIIVDQIWKIIFLFKNNWDFVVLGSNTSNWWTTLQTKKIV